MLTALTDKFLGGWEPVAIAVLDGKLRVGLSRGELERLAKAGDVLKLSRADLAYGVVSGRPGATTVAATDKPSST